MEVLAVDVCTTITRAREQEWGAKDIGEATQDMIQATEDQEHSQHAAEEEQAPLAAMHPQSLEVPEESGLHIVLVAHLCTMQEVEVEVSKTSVKGAMWELAAMAAEVTVG